MRLFGKILKNECDEEFRLVQLHVKDTLTLLMKQIIQEKHPNMAETQLNATIESIQHGAIEPWLWHKVLERMYDISDQKKLVSMISE